MKTESPLKLAASERSQALRLRQALQDLMAELHGSGLPGREVRVRASDALWETRSWGRES